MSIKINRLEEGRNSYPLVCRRPAETVSSKGDKYVIDEELQHTDHLFLGVACFTFLNFVWKICTSWFVTSIWRIPAYTIPTALFLSCWRRRGIEKRAKLCGKFLSPFVYICTPDSALKISKHENDVTLP
jgi:hypothetical protein